MNVRTLGCRRLRIDTKWRSTDGSSPKNGTEWKSRLNEEPSKTLSPARCSCHVARSFIVLAWWIREEYSLRKLFLGVTFSPENNARPGSATSAMTWLLRLIDQSFVAREARRA